MKKIINRVLNWIRLAFSGFRKLYKKYGKDITTFIYQIRTFVESPQADLVVSLTKTKLDDNLLFALRGAFKAIYKDLEPPDTDLLNNVVFYIKELQKASNPLRAAIYLKLAALILKEVCPQEIASSDADTFIQLSYKLNKEGKI